ncbi:MAG: ABC transporter permease [Carbonactinosporaceae bacterium]
MTAGTGQLRTGRRRGALPRVALALSVLVILFAAVRVATGQASLTSSGQVAAGLSLAVPIGLAALGGLWSERVGVINIGLEGMMILGTWFGAWAGFQWGPWAGVLAGVLGGALGGLLHAVATVSFGVDHIVSGVAINILAAGLVRYLSSLAFVGTEGGGITQSPPVPEITAVTVPGVSGWLSEIGERQWFLVSDVAGILGGFVTHLSVLTILAVALVPVTYYVLWRTSFGLRLRSCGESPAAAESLGVPVYRLKYVAIVISGGLAGLGGVFLVTVASSIYREGQTAGRGFIGLAAMIFGNWRPGGLAGGAALFGYTDALQLRAGGGSVHALLLLVAVLLVGYGGWQLARGAARAAFTTGVVAAALAATFLATTTVPGEFTSFLPHLTTLLVLSLATQRLRPPKAIGRPYRRGAAT